MLSTACPWSPDIDDVVRTCAGEDLRETLAHGADGEPRRSRDGSDASALHGLRLSAGPQSPHSLVHGGPQRFKLHPDGLFGRHKARRSWVEIIVDPAQAASNCLNFPRPLNVVTADAPNISVMVHLPELWFPASRGISSHLPNRPDSKRCTLQPSPPRASRRFRGLELRPVAVTTQHLHKGSGTSLRDDPDHGLRAGPKGGPSPLGRRKC